MNKGTGRWSGHVAEFSFRYPDRPLTAAYAVARSDGERDAQYGPSPARGTGTDILGPECDAQGRDRRVHVAGAFPSWFRRRHNFVPQKYPRSESESGSILKCDEQGPCDGRLAAFA
jgi:hypothetical protein